ncbi:MAG: hypothetical protein IIC91_14580 [Chloroflexi bacterium]|nr:hypothetical protein [Chloroflexota bacterium]
MSDLSDTLKQRQKEYRTQLDGLDMEFVAVKKQINHVQDLLEHVDALLRNELGTTYLANELEMVVPSPEWAQLSVPKAVQRLLREAERPMHADDIKDALESRGMKFSRKDPKANIVTALVRGMRRGIFARTAPNTYRLIEANDDGGDATD